MKILPTLAAAAVGASTLVVGAIADDAVSAHNCNYREICFYDYSNASTSAGWYKTLSRALNHTNILWVNGTNGSYLRNDANSVINRDSACDIKVVDDRGWYPDDVQNIPNNGLIYNLGSSVRNQNDRHEKGSC